MQHRRSSSLGEPLMRSHSAPPSFSDERPSQSGNAGRKGGESGSNLIMDPAGVCRIKNLDTGKEFVLSEVSKDGNWGRLNDLQTGLQITMEEFERFLGYSPLIKELMRRVNLGGGGGGDGSGPQINPKITQSLRNKSMKSSGYRKKGGWLKNIKFVTSSVTWLIEKERGDTVPKSIMSSSSDSSSELMKVRQHGKSYKELTGLYMCQEIHAHQGCIWTIKFSLDARYLASAGEDRVIHVWQVQECDTPSSSLRYQEAGSSTASYPVANGSPDRLPLLGIQPSKKMKKAKSKKASIPDYIVIPEAIFSLSEKPVCSFQGHLDDVLDLSWSKSQHLLSSSMDKTVRLWDMETKACLKLFAHNDYVTCIQFNPIDDRYFISGSLDAKFRIWSIPARQVVDWSDLHEMVTAVSYTPDGQGAVVGSHKGTCRFYKTSDCKLSQECQIDIRNKKKKSHTKKITGFQFAPGNPSEVLITSVGSQIRVFDGGELIHKFRGFRNTSSQISASFTSDGKYVVCASEDSHVYLWKREPTRGTGSTGRNKGWSTTRAYEHFYCKDVSVALPWPNAGSNSAPPSLPPLSGRHDPRDGLRSDSRRLNSSLEDNSHASGSSPPLPPLPPLPKKSSQQKLAPEELRSTSNSVSSIGSESFASGSDSLRRSAAISSSISDPGNSSFSSSWGWYSGSSKRICNMESTNAWGLVVVTAGLGGDIRIYQNFGLPIRLSRQTNLF